MKLNEIAIRRPIAVAMGVAVVLLFGFLSITRLELDLLPDLRLPIVGIVTVYPGAAPQAVEGEITTPVEMAISTVAGLKSLESYSMENVSVIVATFGWGVDPTQAMNDINAQLATLTAALPANAIKPVVANIDPRMFSLLTIGVTGLDDVADLSTIAEDDLKPQIERIPGVARVNLVAGVRPEITVYFNTEALRQNSVPPALLYEFLNQQNALVPAGTLESDGVRYNVRVGNPLSDVEEIRNLVIGEKKTTGLEAAGFAALIPQMLFVRDVAKVVEGTSPQQAYARVNGQPAVLLQVYKQSGKSSVSVSQAVRQALPDLVSGAADVQLAVLGDQSEFITEALTNVRDAAIIGSILAIAVLFLFLRSWRAIAVVAISIPLSVVAALVLMYAGGFTLNLLSMGGLALAIGTLVDNSIVVLESVARHRQQGKGAQEAAYAGASRVALAISASTLTTVVVFLPLAYLQSTAGRWFRDMAFTVTFALLASMVVAIMVVPAAAAKLLSKAPLPTESRANPGWTQRLRERYVRLLTQVMPRSAWVWCVALLLIALGVTAPRCMPIELLPSVNSGAINATLTMPAGTPTHITNSVAAQLEGSIASIDGVASVWSQVGQENDDVVQVLYGGGHHVAQLHVLLESADGRGFPTRAVADRIRQVAEEIDLSGAHLNISTERLTDSLGDAFTPGATIQVSGQNLAVLEEQAALIAQAMREAGGFTEITTSVDQRQPELLFTVDRTKALLGSMTTSVVGLTLRGALSGLEATRIQRDGKSIPVVLRAQPDDIDGLDALLNLSIQGVPSGTGPMPAVRFGRVVETNEAMGPVTIQHIDRVRTIAVSARLDGIDLGEAQKRANQIIDSLDLPPGVMARLAGVHDTIQEAVDELWLVLVLAILLVYMVMAAQFESLLYPLIIMITVPLGIAGGLVCLWITGQSIGVSAIMGLVVLTGVVVGNGIVMVDAANQERRRGVSVDEAILVAAGHRLRPILMTSLTTIFGLLPLAFGHGEGTQLQRPLAIAYMGGMLFSTVLTLFLVPSAYRLFSLQRKEAAKLPEATLIDQSATMGPK